MSTFAFTPPIRRALRLDVYDALREAIINGSIKPGERINELEIARQMSISRAPIREAVCQLEQEGLLESKPRRGTFVVELSRADVEEVYTLRADIESRAVRRAIHLVDVDALESLVDQMVEAAERRDLKGLLEADIEFHRSLIQAANWPRLRKIWDGLHPQTLTVYTITTLTDWSLPAHAARHHPIIDAIRNGDPDVAVSAIETHILGVCREIIDRLDNKSNA